MPKTPLVVYRERTQRRKHGSNAQEFFDFFFGVKEVEEYLRAEIARENEEKEKATKEAKEKGVKETRDNFFVKRFTFGHMLFAVLTAGPICGMFGYLFLRLLFG